MSGRPDPAPAAPAPVPGPNPEPIFQAATGFMAAKQLFVANELGVFPQLAGGPATLAELAARLGIPARTARIVVDAMVAQGFLVREGNRYRNSALAETYLAGRPGMDLRPFLRFWNRLSYPRWMTLEQAVRAGRGVLGMLEFASDEEQRIFSEGVESFSRLAAVALPEAYNFTRHRRVLDLGGGTGSFLKPLLERHPNLDCTLFETPAAAAVARRRLAEEGFADRIRIVEGDFFRDPIPEGYDAVLMANVIHIFLPEKNRELFQRIRQRVAAGVRLLLVDLWTNPEHTEPAFAALMAGEFLVMSGTGDVYSEAEARGWFAQTGWREVEWKPLAGPASVLVAEAR